MQLKKRVLILGFFASARSKNYRSVCEDLADHLHSIGWEVWWASGYRNRIIRLLSTLWSIFIYRNRYDIAQVDVYSGLAFNLSEVTCWALRLVGKRYILTLHGGNLPNYSQRYPKRVSRLLQSGWKVTAPSNYLRESLQQFRSDIILIPNPLTLAEYTFRLRSSPTPQILWLRAFHQIYNPILALKVIDTLRQRYPNIRLAMVGPDKHDGSLEQVQAKLHERGIEQYVNIVGGVPKSDVPKWLDQYDIFLNTTFVDNTPVSITEAMASGLCIVSTNVGGIPALLTDQIEALLVPPDNVELMSAAIDRILTDQAFAKQLSGNARKRAEGFDWDILLKTWDALLTESIPPHV